MAVLHTHVSPTSTPAFTAEWETNVQLGDTEGYGSLDTTGSTYAAAYDYASIGLQSGQEIDFGVLAAPPNIAPTNDFAEREAGNIKNSGLFELTTEGLEVTTPMLEIQPKVLSVAIPNGIKYDIDGDVEQMFFTAGGACSFSTLPLFISAFNTGCYAQSSSAVATGIRGFAMTIYKTYCSSGVNFGDLVSNGLNQMDLVWTAISWTERIIGNRFYSLLVY